MKVSIGWLLSWTLYWVGDGVSRVMNNRYLAWLYPTYNRLMLASSDIQEWAGCEGPWTSDEE